MEEAPTSSSGTSPMKYIVPIAVIALIVIAAVFFFNQNNTQTKSTQSTQEALVPTIQQETQQPTQSAETAIVYVDGTYEAVGNYVSPGGPRTIDLTITLADGVITDSTFIGNATDPTSMRFQGEFGDNYQPMIIGKNIDEVSLTKVAGSSLTPKGFTDALSKIKTQAQS